MNECVRALTLQGRRASPKLAFIAGQAEPQEAGAFIISSKSSGNKVTMFIKRLSCTRYISLILKTFLLSLQTRKWRPQKVK